MEDAKLITSYKADPNSSQIAFKLMKHNMREYLHSQRVMEYAMHIAERLALNDAEKKLLVSASLLHDIGKIKVDNHILNKSTQLTEVEYQIIKNHTLLGYEILNNESLDKRIVNAVLTHHERWDGSGYPSGLSGNDVDIKSRIIAVADSFDAMITIRPYKKAMSIREAYGELIRFSNILYDPEVVRALIDYVYDTKDKRANIKIAYHRK